MYYKYKSKMTIFDFFKGLPSQGPVGPHPLRNRPMPFGAQSLLSHRSRRDQELRPAHPLAGWGSFYHNE